MLSAAILSMILTIFLVQTKYTESHETDRQTRDFA